MTFRDIPDFWPSRVTFADDVRVTLAHVRQMRCRDNIPAAYWGRIITAAERRNIPVDARLLMRLAQNRAGRMSV